MSNRHNMGRRQFLIASSVAALATAAVGPRLFAADAGRSSARRLAVGYADLADPVRVVSAADIPAGDGAFIGRGARVLVTGASERAQGPRERRAVELVANYSYLDGAERRVAPFRAWGCSRVTGCSGNGVAFTVPIDEVQKISFVVTAESGAPAGSATRREALSIEPTETTPLPLTIGLQDEIGAFKLVRGYYVVVPLFENDSEPQWSLWSVAATGGRATLVGRDGAGAPFEHLVLRIDYAAS